MQATAMRPVQHYEPGAEVVGSCPCGGDLRLVEDEGPRRPLVTQCEDCRVLTGLARVSTQLDLAGAPEVPPAVREDWAF